MKDKIITFIETLEITNIELFDLIDTSKIIKHIDDFQIKLNTINYILCQDQEELEKRIKILYSNNKDVFDILPYLVAISKDKINKEDSIFKYKNSFKRISEFLESPEMIIDFINMTKLNELIIKGKIKNFEDYLFGVEVGLDSNARKNRIGQKNEKEIYDILKNEFEKYSYVEIKKQLMLDRFKNKDLLKNKKWDFVIENKLNNKCVIIETSFYNTSGSKINETLKSFENINNLIKEYENYYFSWVTDGCGLKTISSSIINNSSRLDFMTNKNNFINEIKKWLEIK